MRPGVNVAVYVLLSFFIVTIVLSFYYYRQYPALAVAGEVSPGTWLSGVLLTCCAGVSLVLAIHRGWNPWAYIASFLFLLTADEHFMLHERIKQWIAFNVNDDSLLIRESPVFVGAITGGWIVWSLWRRVAGSARTLLLIAVIFGLGSVLLDVIGSAAIWEESLKLVAELSAACAFLSEAGKVTPGKEYID